MVKFSVQLCIEGCGHRIGWDVFPTTRLVPGLRHDDHLEGGGAAMLSERVYLEAAVRRMPCEFTPRGRKGGVIPGRPRYGRGRLPIEISNTHWQPIDTNRVWSTSRGCHRVSCTKSRWPSPAKWKTKKEKEKNERYSS